MRVRQILVLGLIGAIFYVACTSQTDPAGRSGATSGTLRVRSVIEFTDADADALPSEFAATLREHGWVRTASGFERSENPQTFSVTSGGSTSPVADDGSFRSESAADLRLNYQGYALNPAIVPLTREEHDGRVTLTLTLSVSEHLRHHAHGHAHPKAGDPQPESHLPCLDYNGPWGNQRPNQPFPQSAYNFNGSDCMSAWPVCMVRDFTWWPYCNGHRNCSAIIGHCGTYHRHTYPGGPSC